MSKKRKRNNVVVLAELWLTDADGNPVKVKVKGHRRSQKKRLKLAVYQEAINQEQVVPDEPNE
jgi:hypothetical protein